MDDSILRTAMDVLKISMEEAKQYSKPLPELDAFYFWKPTRGGGKVIIKTNGEKLAAGSALSFDKVLSAFQDGKRN